MPEEKKRAIINLSQDEETLVDLCRDLRAKGGFAQVIVFFQHGKVTSIRRVSDYVIKR